jgi:hypothetical protein
MTSPLNIKLIRIDGGTQSRAAINQAVVDQYAEAIKDGAEFPAVRVYHDGNFYYLADGFHRYFAHLKAAKAGIKAEVVNGTLRDAILYSFSANALHGLQRTVDDKRKVVMAMLEDFEWSTWTDREIARLCHVSHPFVGQLRASMGNPQEESRKYKTSTGKVAERKVEFKLPTKPASPLPQPAEEDFDPRDELIETLTNEVTELNDKLAVASIGGESEEKDLAAKTIAELREQIRILEIDNTALKKSRDQFQNENAQMKRQIAMLQKKLKPYE